MREIVCIGPEETAKSHLLRAKDAVTTLLGELGLDYKIEVATDPFFDKNSGKAKMQRLFPVKEEFVVNGLAIGSVNYHRNSSASGAPSRQAAKPRTPAASPSASNAGCTP